MCLVNFLKVIIEVLIPNMYMRNDDIIGAAALIQGYVARLGFGITLTKNQQVETMPSKKKASLYLLLILIMEHKILNEFKRLSFTIRKIQIHYILTKE
jgi:hypothetical protein